MRYMVLVAPVMLICGLSLGAGASTLYWSGVADSGFKAQAEWKKLTDDSNGATESALHAAREWERASNSFEKTANECLATLRASRR